MSGRSPLTAIGGRMAGSAADDEHIETLPLAPEPQQYGSMGLSENANEAPDPMDPATYKAVCEFMGRNMVDEFPEGQFDPEHKHFEPEELMVRQDLAKSKAHWSNDYYGDRRRFLYQMHPILALMYSHRLHMISRNERIVVYIVQLFFILLVSLTYSFAGRCGQGQCSTVGTVGVGAGHQCVLPFTMNGETFKTCTTRGFHTSWCPTKTDAIGHYTAGGKWGECWCASDKDGEIEECWELTDGKITKRELHSIICCFGHATGAQWFAHTFGAGLGGTIYAMVLNTIFSLGSFQFMICGCVQKALPKIRKGGEFLGHCIYSVITILILLPQPYLIMYAYRNGLLLASLWIFLSGKLSGSVGLYLLQVLAFYLLWHVQDPKNHECAGDDPKKHSRNCMASFSEFHVDAGQYEAYLKHLRSSV